MTEAEWNKSRDRVELEENGTKKTFELCYILKERPSLELKDTEVDFIVNWVLLQIHCEFDSYCMFLLLSRAAPNNLFFS